MKELSKKDLNEVLAKTKEALNNIEDDVVIVSERMVFCKGNPIGILANICRVIEKIAESDPLGRIAVEATIQSLTEEFIKEDK